MIPLILIAFLAWPASCQQDQDEPDILSAHGGVFRALDWTNEELAEISALHTTASHHKLMQLVAVSAIRTSLTCGTAFGIPPECVQRKVTEKKMMRRGKPLLRRVA